MADYFAGTSTSAAALAAMCTSMATVNKLMAKGLLARDDVSEIFDAALIALESIAPAESPDVKLARALVDAQAQLILTGRQPKPPAL